MDQHVSQTAEVPFTRIIDGILIISSFQLANRQALRAFSTKGPSLFQRHGKVFVTISGDHCSENFCSHLHQMPMRFKA